LPYRKLVTSYIDNNNRNSQEILPGQLQLFSKYTRRMTDVTLDNLRLKKIEKCITSL